MDGLLLETGRLAYRAYVKSAQKYDYEMRKEVYYLLTGQTEMAIREQMAFCTEKMFHISNGEKQSINIKKKS